MRIAQGRDNVRVYLKENPEFYQEVETKLREDLVQGGAKGQQKEKGLEGRDGQAAEPQLDI
jgi:hypothetical protein